jgi:hypothetical protein
MSEAERARDDVLDRVRLARRWLGVLLPGSLPGSDAAPGADEDDPLVRAILRHWVEASRAMPLDRLGRYVAELESGAEAPPVSWLSRDAVRAVFLIRALRTAGVGL